MVTPSLHICIDMISTLRIQRQLRLLSQAGPSPLDLEHSICQFLDMVDFPATTLCRLGRLLIDARKLQW